MPVTVCTGWGPSGYALYGNRFLETFRKHWPTDVRLITYVEEMVGVARTPARQVIIERSLGRCDGVLEFIARHKDEPTACGRDPAQLIKASDKAAGYNFRFDAVKFCRQLFIPQNAAADLPDGHVLVWLDADVVTHSDVPTGFIENLVGKSDLIFLGRGEKHSEIGFWAVQVNPITREFLASLAQMYRSDEVFGLKEWHSAYVFDRCRREQSGMGQMKARDLTPGGRGHVWFQSPLCRFTDHLKGDRKLAGMSTERRK